MPCNCGGDCCQQVTAEDEYFNKIVLPIIQRASEATDSAKELLARIAEEQDNG